jgi:hypothetical protein
MKKVEQTRRDFLCLAGKGVVGAAALSCVPTILNPAIAETVEAPAYPLEYKQLDPQKVLEEGYKRLYTHGGCGGGAFSAIVDVMGEEYGYPYNQFNGSMFANAAAGYGVGAICGSLAGACAAIGVFCGPADARALRDDLFTWYKQHSFPQYQPEYQSVTTVSGSVQCADSVGHYMQETNLQMGDAARVARCAAVTGETAAKAVELLNKHFGFSTEEVVLVDNPDAQGEEAPLGMNEYIGVGKSEIGGDIRVKVTMDCDKISKIEVLEHNETDAFAKPVFDTLPAAVIAAQSTEVDTVAGSTKTSEALIAAINDALSQAKGK